VTIWILLGVGCGGGGPEPCGPADEGTQVVGPQGGVVTMGEVAFRFPPGALDRCQAFVVSAVPAGALAGAPAEGAVQIAPEVELKRSVVVQMPGGAAETTQLTIGQWQPAGEWTPMMSIPSPDRRLLLARTRRLGSFGVGPRPAPMCRVRCGGEVVGNWEMQGLCTLLALDRRCPESRVQLLMSSVASLDGRNFRQESDNGPMTVFAPKTCLPALQATRCEDLARLLAASGSTATCSNVSETECGCMAEPQGDLAHGVASGTYTLDGDQMLFTGTRVEGGSPRTMTGEPTPFCREGDTLSLFVNFTAIHVMRPQR
jgi:hypothetical protein